MTSYNDEQIECPKCSNTSTWLAVMRDQYGMQATCGACRHVVTRGRTQAVTTVTNTPAGVHVTQTQGDTHDVAAGHLEDAARSIGQAAAAIDGEDGVEQLRIIAQTLGMSAQVLRLNRSAS